MAGKVSTLILTVDLGCHLCSEKIRKTLSKLQDREHIASIFYDDKKNTVTISGQFDPQKLKKKILCKACKVITEITVKAEEKKPPPLSKDTKPPESDKTKSAPLPKEKETEKPKEKEAGKEKPKEKEKHVTFPEAAKEKPTEKEKETEKPKEKEKEKVKDVKPAEREKEKPKPTTQPELAVEDQPMLASGPFLWGMPVCCWCPCHEWFSGGCRCSSCGKFFGWTAAAPTPAGVCPGSGYTYQFFCEEDSSCRIM